MQFIESSLYGVRAAKHILKSPHYDIEIMLLPMIHIGEEAFYSEVKSQLDTCASFLYEGVPGFRSRLITSSYRLLTYRKDLDLVYQGELLSRKHFGGNAIHADYDKESADRN